MRPVVLIPTFNERENLPTIVARVLELTNAHILVIDDSSPDGTGEVADELARADARVYVMHRAEKSGLGRAYLAGFNWALDRDYTHVVEMDADLSHRPIDLPRLFARSIQPDHPDLVIGSRWVKGGTVENWPFARLALSRCSNLYVRVLTGVRVLDATAGFRVYRREILERLQLEDVESQGYSFQVDMTLRVDEAGGSISEVPITFVERTVGDSKMDGAVISESAIRTAKWGAQRRGRQFRTLAGTLANRCGVGGLFGKSFPRGS